MRFFCDYVSQCISCVAQDNYSSSSVAQRHQKVGHLWKAATEEVEAVAQTRRACGEGA